MLVLAALLGSAHEARAQEPVDSLRAEVARLAALVDSLGREVTTLREAGDTTAGDDALAALRAAAAAAAGAGPQPVDPDRRDVASGQRSLQALNPEISVNADVFGHVDTNDVGRDNFVAREFEISIISNLDPFSRARIFLSRHTPGGEISPFAAEEEEPAGFGIEEGFVEWVGLPGGLSLKFGKFFQQFGQLNRWHAHALPFQTRSLPHLAFVGEEALAQTGASLHWLVPIRVASGAYEFTLEATRSQNEALFGESAGMSLLGHVNAFWDLSGSTDLDLGLSWVRGTYEDPSSSVDRNLVGAELALTWRPPGAARYRGLTFRGGLMALDGLVPAPAGGAAPPPRGRAWGYWGAGEARLSERWLVGGRLDRSENPHDPDETAWLLSPTLTWWQSEWVRLRLEYDLLGRSFTSATEGRLLLQLTFALGPHRHATY